jgi:hypothetical protein
VNAEAGKSALALQMQDELLIPPSKGTAEYQRSHLLAKQAQYVSRLADAERHIVESERRVSRHLQRIGTRQASGLDTAEAERRLLVTQAGLAEWQAYREQLLRAIEQMNDRSSSSALAKTAS